MKTPRQRRKNNYGAIRDIARTIDLLAVFDSVSPWLVKLLKDRPNITAEEMYKEAAEVVAARGIDIALSEKDSGKALAAVKEILDRSQGKARDRQEVTHRLEKLPDQELDAVLLTKLQDLNSAEKKLKN